MSLTPQIIELIKNGHCNAAIADEVGCSTHYVRAVRSRAGYTKDQKRNRIQKRISKLQYELEMAHKELAAFEQS